MGRRWVRKNDRHCLPPIALHSLSPSDVASSMYDIQRIVFVCFSFFFHPILYVLRCVRFGPLSISFYMSKPSESSVDDFVLQTICQIPLLMGGDLWGDNPHKI